MDDILICWPTPMPATTCCSGGAEFRRSDAECMSGEHCSLAFCGGCEHRTRYQFGQQRSSWVVPVYSREHGLNETRSCDWREKLKQTSYSAGQKYSRQRHPPEVCVRPDDDVASSLPSSIWCCQAASCCDFGRTSRPLTQEGITDIAQ